eukprot:GHUV01041551.1.p1 GENE.GHUV01041551.1~~GHUV01041551.1.p1  ORF type:complete len:131 (-),score=28.90 GHUV01041551.1:351-743(-)
MAAALLLCLRQLHNRLIFCLFTWQRLVTMLIPPVQKKARATVLDGGCNPRRSDHTLMRLMTGYPAAAPAAQRCAYVAGQLGLAGHADPGRLFAVGQLMPGALLGMTGDEAARAACRKQAEHSIPKGRVTL